MNTKQLTIIFPVLMLAFLAACTSGTKSGSVDYTQYVDPFIGTDGIVHTFPGATYPFGMVQLSPDGDTQGWNWCSGYHYSDDNIKGFSHTHLSGTGWSDLGDILVMPTVGEIKLNSGSKDNPDEGYRSRINHDDEEASPGYYRVKLQDYNINAELTTSRRVGFHKYTFPASDQSNVIIDPTNKIFGRTIETQVSIKDESTIEGYCYSSGWGGNRYIYFTASFSKPFKMAGVGLDDKVMADAKEVKGVNAKGFASFTTTEGEMIEMKLAFSAVSLQGARKNMATEGSEKTFEEVREKTKAAWQKELAKIEVSGGSEDQKKIFYTGLYHAMIHPNISMDVDGGYVAMGKKLNTQDFTNYSTFSLWDTHRAVHPLLTMIDTKRTTDFVKSLVSRHENGGQLPMWELCGYDNVCMIGYPAVSVIADAILKDIPGIDVEKAYEAMRAIAFFPKNSSSDGESGLNEYNEYGYVPADIAKSVAKTLEYSYYDWCIAKVAEKLGKTEDAELFYQRSKSFVHHYNADKKLFWPKDRDGNWLDGISLTSWEDLMPHYVSGNIWAYAYFYPHATNMVIDLMGGKDAFTDNLDSLFAQPMNMEGEQHVDISGFIGHYGHGDEPGHQIAYLYNYAGKPWKTQEKVREISNTMYFAKNDGMPNNDDCGQMSAWYIYSALGFYPVCPGDLTYIIGTPLFENAAIHLEDGKSFHVEAVNVSADNKYVQSVELNGKPYSKSYITHLDIMNGGKLTFTMGSQPNKNWGSAEGDRPVSDLFK